MLNLFPDAELAYGKVFFLLAERPLCSVPGCIIGYTVAS